VRVTYFDEVKANPQNGQHWYVVGGLSVPIDDIPRLEERVNALSEEVFDTRDLTPASEFHAAHIYFGKGVFRKMDVERRVDILAQLGRVIAEADGTKRVYAAINTPKLYKAADAPEYAFAHFCERVEMSLERGTKTILIGDQDDQHARAMIADFARYRTNGTPWDFGIQIKGIVDAVHFCRSHHSRMIQLADAYLFLETHGWGSRKGWMADMLRDKLEGVDLHAHRYKDWPK
jgi:hypothetical protein